MTTITDRDVRLLESDLKNLSEQMRPGEAVSWRWALLVLLRLSTLSIQVHTMQKMVEILARKPTQEIDPDDHLTDTLLELQRDIRGILKEIEHSGGEGLLMAIIRRKLKNLHRRIGRLRVWILEHDADCSEIGPIFDNADDLIAYLDKTAENHD